ncbi:cellulose binding domain-containing protein [Actinomadura macrotermitis]|uniref:cellulose binding domain-containing protein n=1 Tax=Actinomadura macrotermitis TaxID=2585200 RepID=UPI002E262493
MPGPRQAPEPGEQAAKKRRSGVIPLVPVPLLPIFALVIAVGVVAYAFSTQQISLNFAAPAHEPQSDGPHEGQMAERGDGTRASRGTRDAGRLTTAFQVVRRTPTGFTGSVTITNRGTAPVLRWSLAFGFTKATVRSFSGGATRQTGRRGWVRSLAGAPPLAPGQSVKVVFTARGTAGAPATCVLNRAPCARA